MAFGIVILFLNQEVIVATWPVSHDVQVIVEKRNVNTKERVFFFKPGSNRSNMAGFTGSASAQLAQHRVTFPLRVKVAHFRDVAT